MKSNFFCFEDLLVEGFGVSSEETTSTSAAQLKERKKEKTHGASMSTLLYQVQRYECLAYADDGMGAYSETRWLQLDCCFVHLRSTART